MSGLFSKPKLPDPPPPMAFAQKDPTEDSTFVTESTGGTGGFSSFVSGSVTGMKNKAKAGRKSLIGG